MTDEKLASKGTGIFQRVVSPGSSHTVKLYGTGMKAQREGLKRNGSLELDPASQ